MAAGLWDRSESALQVARLYSAALGRLPDAGGLGFWTQALDAGTLQPEVLAAALLASPEYAAAFNPADDRAFADDAYARALGRTPDAGGLNHWTTALDAGTSRAAVTLAFADSAEHHARTAADTGGETPETYGIRLA